MLRSKKGDDEIEEDSELVVLIRTDYVKFLSQTPFNDTLSATKYGTAFLVGIDGASYLLTAHHVVENYEKIFASTHLLKNGETMECKSILWLKHSSPHGLHGSWKAP